MSGCCVLWGDTALEGLSPLGEKGRGSIPPGDSLLRNVPGRQRVFAALLLNIGVLTWPVELLTSTGLIGP